MPENLKITNEEMGNGWQLYYRGVIIHRRYAVVKKIEGGYIVLTPNPDEEILRDGSVRHDMANVKTCDCKRR